VDAADLGLLMQLVPVIGPAVESIGEVIPEAKDLSEAEAAELTAYIVAKLVIEDAKARLILEKALGLAVAGFGLYKAVKA
jgi:hypothetical protein